MAGEMLKDWANQPGRISWSRWDGIQEYYLDEAGFEQSKLPNLAPKHPAFEPGYQFSDWAHFIPRNAVSRIRSSQNFESEYQKIISEIFTSIEQDLDAEPIPLVAQWDDDYSQTATYEEKRQAIEAFLCRVFTLQMRGDVNFEKIHNSNTDIPAEASMEPPEREISVSVERYADIDRIDIVQFNIENPSEFFAETYGDSTLMFEKLYGSDKKPKDVRNSLKLDHRIFSQWRIHTGISYSN